MVLCQLRRLNSTSLAVDACDSLQRPVAGSSRLLPPSAAMGILDTGSKRGARKAARDTEVEVVVSRSWCTWMES